MTSARTALLLSIALFGPAGCTGRAPEDREAAARAKAAADTAARAEADARRERTRLADLWTYTTVPAGKGQQITASIKSVNDVDADAKTPKWVLLVFRDHPAWGRSSYLVLQNGDFNCYGHCTVKVAADAAAARPMAAHRPKTDEAIAMFIDDTRAFYRLTAAAKQVSVEFPVKVGGTRTASFEVAGLDRSKLLGWDSLPSK